jgi:hypothetical protein
MDDAKVFCPNCAVPVPATAQACPLCRHALAGAAAGPEGWPVSDAKQAARSPLASSPKEWLIPCPKGHVHAASAEWIGKEKPAVCPTCNEPFLAAVSDSIAMQEERRRRQEAEDAKFAAVWLTRAIWAAVLVVGFLVALVVISLAR